MSASLTPFSPVFCVSNNLKKLCSIIIMAFFCLGVSFEYSDAASRFGGGRSFGGGSSFKSPAPAPKTPSRSIDQGASKQAAPGAGAMAQSPSRFGFGGGMLGGLLMGGLLGSLFMGGGFNGTNMMDILIIGALIYFGLKLFRSWKAKKDASAGSAPRSGNAPTQAPRSGANGNVNSSARDHWERLRSKPSGSPDSSGSGSGPSSQSSMFNSSPQSGFGNAEPAAVHVSVPDGFDTAEFLNGAKGAYIRLQEAWGKRDLAGVTPLLTREMLAEVREQFADSPAEGPTEILLVEAELASFEQRGDNENAGVMFSVLLREAGQRDSQDVRELWTFTRKRGENWLLNGLQQVE